MARRVIIMSRRGARARGANAALDRVLSQHVEVSGGDTCENRLPVGAPRALDSAPEAMRKGHVAANKAPETVSKVGKNTDYQLLPWPWVSTNVCHVRLLAPCCRVRDTSGCSDGCGRGRDSPQTCAVTSRLQSMAQCFLLKRTPF
jgi:hypothetical protein